MIDHFQTSKIQMPASTKTRRSLRLGAVSLTVAAAALLSGCAMLPTAAPSPTQSTASVSTPSTQPTRTTTAAPSDSRAQLLAALPRRPANAPAWAKVQDPSALGALTPEQFIKADYKPAAWSSEPGVQKARGLQFAARQDWYDPSNGTYVNTFIIHYGTDTGADSDYLAQVEIDAKDYDAHGSFTVPGIPQSTVFVKTELDSFGNAATMGLALVGDNVLRTYMLTPAAPNHAEIISLLTGEQRALNRD